MAERETKADVWKYDHHFRRTLRTEWVLKKLRHICYTPEVMQPSLLHRWLIALEYGTILFVILAVVFTALEQNFSFRKLKKPWRDTWIDVQFFFFGLLLPPVVNFALAAFCAYFTIPTRRMGLTKPSPLRFALELLAVLVAFDIWTYCRHRVFHSRKLWKIHSVHHSSEDLNWTSGPRNHYAEVAVDLIGEFAVFTVAALSGVGPRVLLVAGVVIGAWNFFVHANLNWSFGPLRYIVVSPMHHRWHHSDIPEAADKNFAVMFSFIDIVLGTAYMPKGALPKTTGVSGEERNKIPRTFIGQLLYPFRR